MSHLVTSTLLLFSLAPGEVPHQPEIDNYVTKQMAALNIPGLSLAIVYKGETYTKAWGRSNVELNVAATCDTVYEIASMSKPLLATVAVLLTRDETPPFRLEDKVGKHLPELPAAWGDITIRHLLSHLSGIKEYLNIREFSPHREYSDGDLLSLASRYPLNFTPGEQFDYTNTGYCVQAMVMERTTKKCYGDILNERIFRPLEMRSTRVNDSTAIIKRRAGGYAFRFGRLLHADFVAPSQLAFGDCGVISTVNDLVRWDKEMWNKESKVLPRALLNDLWTRAKLNDGSFIDDGLGWELYCDAKGTVSSVYHGGAIEGFRSIVVRYLLDELSVIVLFNGELEPWKNNYFARDIADLVVGSKTDQRLGPRFNDNRRHTGLARH
jgi:CubicO group peptidase (beta-lactamase class C family)